MPGSHIFQLDSLRQRNERCEDEKNGEITMPSDPPRPENTTLQGGM